MTTQTTQPTGEKRREFGVALSLVCIVIGFFLLCISIIWAVYLITLGILGLAYMLGDHEYHYAGLIMVGYAGLLRIILDQSIVYTIITIISLGLAFLLSPTKNHFLQFVIIALCLLGLGALAT